MAFGCFFFSIGAVTVLSGLAFAKYMGFFKKIIVRDIRFSPSYLVFTRYQGSYKSLMPTINSVKEDLYKFCNDQTDLFPLAPSPDQLKTFGIYYDRPDLIVDESKSRAVIGAMIPITENLSESDFLEFLEIINSSSKNQYHFAKFTEDIIGFGSTFPLLNVLSIIYAVLRGYPMLKDYGIKNNLFHKTKFSMEVYDRFEKSLTIAFPYQGDLDNLLLSEMSQPDYYIDPFQHCGLSKKKE